MDEAKLERVAVSFEEAPIPEQASELPHVEILFPFAEQRIRLAKAPRYRVRLKIARWELVEGKREVEVSLDGQRPVLLTDPKRTLRLEDLVPEDGELNAGEHTLFAVAVDGTGQRVRPGGSSQAPFAIVHFWVGERAKPREDPDAPAVFYGRPRGTYNGEQVAAKILLDYYLLNVELSATGPRLEVTLRGTGVEGRTMLDSWKPLFIKGLPSGDHRVTLRLVDAQGRTLEHPGASVEQVITVNRDAPVVDR